MDGTNTIRIRHVHVDVGHAEQRFNALRQTEFSISPISIGIYFYLFFFFFYREAMWSGVIPSLSGRLGFALCLTQKNWMRSTWFLLTAQWSGVNPFSRSVMLMDESKSISSSQMVLFPRAAAQWRAVFLSPPQKKNLKTRK